jgi:hypothetical protein
MPDGRKRKLVDRVGDAATPRVDSSDVSDRPAWWWIFFMPGKVILWFEYMFPRRLGGVFGSARRRNIPLLQVVYSIILYIAILAGVLCVLIQPVGR